MWHGLASSLTLLVQANPKCVHMKFSYSFQPYFTTRMKMRWDDEFLYVGAELQETQLWANLTVNNSIIYYDNDFEVFVDPDGSNNFYKELEINARNLNWNLLLVRPYLNGGPAVCNW